MNDCDGSGVCLLNRAIPTMPVLTFAKVFEWIAQEWAGQASRNREEITFFLPQVCDAADRLLPRDKVV
jgi:hypothetical protein